MKQNVMSSEATKYLREKRSMSKVGINTCIAIAAVRKEMDMLTCLNPQTYFQGQSISL